MGRRVAILKFVATVFAEIGRRLRLSFQPKLQVVCTLGPKCWGEETLGEMMDAGMNVARFNFSHGDHAGHQEAGTLSQAVI